MTRPPNRAARRAAKRRPPPEPERIEPPPPPPPGLLARVRASLQHRRDRKMVEQLERSLVGLERKEHGSGALLAMITERISRATSAGIPPDELEATIRQVKQIVAEYAAYIRRLETIRDASNDETAAAMLEKLEAGQQRMLDALAQLRALAARS